MKAVHRKPPVRKIVATPLYGVPGAISRLEAAIVTALSRAGRTLSVAESCTGGLIGHRLTSVPGASVVFMGGVMCYSNESKVRDLGVAKSLIERHGAVSKWVAQRMAEGVKSRFCTDLGLAVTGIAGPDGGTKGKPVGTVHIALAYAGGTRSRQCRFKGDRDQIKWQSSEAALELLTTYLTKTR